MDAAARRFVQDGFLEATTLAIARDAGVAHGTLFLHFADRDALLLAVVERLLVDLGTTLHRAYFQAEDLESLCRLFLVSLAGMEDSYGALVKDLPRFPLPLKRRVFAAFASITAHFTEVIEKGQKRGILRAIQPEIANALFFGTLNHFFLYRDLMTSDGRVVPAYGEALVDSFIQLMARERQETGEKGNDV